MKIRDLLCKNVVFVVLSVLLLIVPVKAHAATYTKHIGSFYTNYGWISYTVQNAYLNGYNVNQGFSRQIVVDRIWSTSSSRYIDYYMDYIVPDDGCTWKISGYVVVMITSVSTEGGVSYSYQHIKVDEQRTTSGSFTGYSPKTATDAANTAVTAANAARASADTAATNATNALYAVSNVNGNTITAVRDASGTVLDSARQANAKLDTIQTAVTNIQNNISAGDTTPPTVKIRTVSGAMATSGGSIQAVLDISDNTSSTFTYSLDGSGYSSVPANRIISLTVSVPGVNVIPVWVKDQAGNVGTTSITIRKL
ncbi:MAG: hypothetical protein ACOY40_05415 [Bacillota bacterium]